MTRNLTLTLVCSVLSSTLFAQQYFEGEIDYKLGYQFKGKPDTSTYIPLDPTLRVDPAWYASAKLNYYDVIYGKMKSAYVKMIWETPKFIVTSTATRIQKREVRSEEFAKATSLPVKPL